MKAIIILSVLLVALLLSPLVGAQGPVELDWTEPTTYATDPPKPIPADVEVTYTVYRAGPIEEFTAVHSNGPVIGVTLLAQPVGLQCYYVTASAHGLESVPSNHACKLIRFAAPTDGAIEAPTDGSIEH